MISAGLTISAIEARIAQHEIEIATWRRILSAERGCRHCAHRVGTETPLACGLADDQTSPKDVQSAGCPARAHDYIPF